MSDDGPLAAAAREYAAHYSQRGLSVALQLYKKLVASPGSTPAAAYSHAPSLNIVSSVVPEQELLNTQLALAHLAPDLT